MTRALALLLLSLVMGCPFLPDQQLASEVPPELIALPHDFEAFRTWPSFTVNGDGGDGHPPGERTVFVNAAVDDTGAAFAVGSIIVKASADGLVHAMVKRGNHFNDAGARNWEWFELTEADGGIFIDWRGEDAPDGECYGLLPGQECTAAAASCNACHTGVPGNDYVQSAALNIESVDASLLRP